MESRLADSDPMAMSPPPKPPVSLNISPSQLIGSVCATPSTASSTATDGWRLLVESWEIRGATLGELSSQACASVLEVRLPAWPCRWASCPSHINERPVSDRHIRPKTHFSFSFLNSVWERNQLPWNSVLFCLRCRVCRACQVVASPRSLVGSTTISCASNVGEMPVRLGSLVSRLGTSYSLNS